MDQEVYSEISFSEVILKLKETLRFIVSRWLIIIPICLIGGALGYIYAKSQKPKYSATLSFVLSVETKSSGLGGLASQFGIDLGSSGGSDVFAGDNIMTLFRSKEMISRVLFQKDPITNQLLINTLIKDQQWDEKWLEKSYLKTSIPFTTQNLTPIQDSLLNEVYLDITKNLLNISRPDKKLSEYEVNTTSTNEIFATYLTRYLVDETAKFYIDTKTSIAKQNLNMLQKEADSLKRLLGGSITSTASEVDRTFNLNPALQVQRSSIQKGQVNTQVLGTAYGEVVKNLELAKINLQKETPLYQIIDVPTIPLKAIKVSGLISAIVGLFIAFIFTITVLLIRRKA